MDGGFLKCGYPKSSIYRWLFPFFSIHFGVPPCMETRITVPPSFDPTSQVAPLKGRASADIHGNSCGYHGI